MSLHNVYTPAWYTGTTHTHTHAHTCIVVGIVWCDVVLMWNRPHTHTHSLASTRRKGPPENRGRNARTERRRFAEQRSQRSQKRRNKTFYFVMECECWCFNSVCTCVHLGVTVLVLTSNNLSSSGSLTVACLSSSQFWLLVQDYQTTWEELIKPRNACVARSYGNLHACMHCAPRLMHFGASISIQHYNSPTTKQMWCTCTVDIMHDLSIRLHHMPFP